MCPLPLKFYKYPGGEDSRLEWRTPRHSTLANLSFDGFRTQICSLHTIWAVRCAISGGLSSSL